jgi:hypothetical protein
MSGAVHAAWLPSDRTLHSLRQVLVGSGPNGATPESIEPAWRGLFTRVVADPTQGTLEAELARMGLTSAETLVFARALAARDPDQHAPAPERPEIEILTRADLNRRPRPAWLVADMLQLRSAAEVFGASGIGKSFLALSFACAVCTGRPWFGLEVQQGAVLYIAAEGDDDMNNRIAAWETEHWGSREIDNFYLIPEQLDLRSVSAPAKLLQYMRAALPEDPKLIVVDTLARNMTGDENSTEHMSQFIRQVDVLWRETGATVLIVHHTGKNGESERGSSTVRGGVNTMLRFTEDAENKTLRLDCDKQKNAKGFPRWSLVRKDVDLGEDPVTGEPRSSCVLDLASGQSARYTLPPLQLKILQVLSWSMHASGITSTRLREAVGVKDETARTSMYSAINRLHTLAYITVTGEKRAQTYAVTDHGRDVLRACGGSTDD